MTDPVEHNRAAWDRQVEEGNEWTVPVGPEVIAKAREGDWSIVLIGYEPVPRDWFPTELRGCDVLALASGGGQQAPVLAAVGANVTVFDNSPRQLAQDEMVAAREGLTLRTVQGDMRNLSAFADGSFDMVFHPCSNGFCPEVEPVWRECHRVLRPGGLLLAGFVNPDIYIFDDAALNDGKLVVRHSLPYSDLTHLEPGEHEALNGPGAPLQYSHTMDEQVGGQLRAGFVLTAFAEARLHAGATRAYMPGYFATRAVKA